VRRAAYLLCGDWDQAEDLAQTALVKVYLAWPRLRRRDELNGYVRRVVFRSWLDERRRPWRRERSTDPVPDTAAPADQLDERVTLRRALAAVPPRQRAVLVLRFFEDLGVAECALVLGCSEGTVRSQTARGLATLRRTLGVADREGDRVL
jgi:RNA polymerase sigma-70 factor (sigma-E family)